MSHDTSLDWDVVTIGAGVAGLAATAKLIAAGQRVICLEATARIGGRILTVHDPLASLPVELGAKFIHGLPPETWQLVRQAGLTAYEHTAEALHLDRGRILKDQKVGEIADDMLAQAAKSSRKKDETFEDYLRRSHQSPDLKKWARVHIEGFNAAHSDLVSAASLVAESKAAGEIEGDRSFRILNGYDSIPAALLRSIPESDSVVHLNCVVERVNWRRGFVEVHYRQNFDPDEQTLRCRRLIVTVPLGVLQANPASRGAIRFDPAPSRILRAAASLEFGQVHRVTFRFGNAFWEDCEQFKRAGFLISRDPGFFAWWTMHPILAPLLTGWSAGAAAHQFHSIGESRVAATALESLARILHRKVPAPEAVYYHDWQADPFFRGAYSYAPIGGQAARRALAKPEEDTLFFPGEAANTEWHASTVHGAIASGLKAAGLVLSAG